MVVQPRTTGETPLKENPSVPEFICHDISIQCQVAICKLAIFKSFFINSPSSHNSNWTNTVKFTLFFVLSAHYPGVRSTPFLPAHIRAILHCSSQLPCLHSNSAGTMSDTNVRYAMEGAYITQHSWHMSANLTGEPLSQNGSNDGSMHKAGAAHGAHQHPHGLHGYRVD